ncbi:hypothetical protein F5146DRAFT_1072390 [Armillaria mellea]|nr:hypothetical protein F5146DRAFT_1072390 [Armillaria mellea]
MSSATRLTYRHVHRGTLGNGAFGIAFKMTELDSGQTVTLKKYEPFKDRKPIIGSLYRASLNCHNGIDLAPRDDLETLVYIALFLLRDHLPWKPRSHLGPKVRSQEIIQLMKLSC